MSNIAGKTTFEITNTKSYVPIVNLLTKDNVNLTKNLIERFKRTVYWNEYKTKIESRNLDNDNPTRFYLDASFDGVKRLFVLAFDSNNNRNNKVERGIHRINFILRVNITHFKVLIDGRNFYDQSVNSQIKKYDENPKIATEQRDDYTTGCFC